MSTKRYEYNLKFAFTMAEAVLVMTILGIIATVMITIMKPAKFKDQGYEVLAKSIYADIDNAITQILADKTPYNNFETIYKSGSNTETFSMVANRNISNMRDFAALLKDYLTTARGNIPSACDKDGLSSRNSLLLKNGACLKIDAPMPPSCKIDTLMPGEKNPTSTCVRFYIYLDVNGNNEPNTLGKDVYIIPFSVNGIHGGDNDDIEYAIQNCQTLCTNKKNNCYTLQNSLGNCTGSPCPICDENYSTCVSECQ